MRDNTVLAIACAAAVSIAAARLCRAPGPAAISARRPPMGMLGERGGTDGDLDLLFDRLRALRDLAADEDASNDIWQRYSFSITWGAMLSGRLHRLDHLYRAEALTPGERHRYERLREQFDEAMPIITRLGLGCPGDIGLGAAAARDQGG